jgi:hypothetical protein
MGCAPAPPMLTLSAEPLLLIWSVNPFECLGRSRGTRGHGESATHLCQRRDTLWRPNGASRLILALWQARVDRRRMSGVAPAGIGSRLTPLGAGHDSVVG